MKGLTVEIFKTQAFNNCDCTNGGISHKVNQAILIGEGLPEIFEPDENTPVLKVVKRNIFGRVYYHCEPIINPTGNGWMFGGNFVYTSDSRYYDVIDYPMPIHDRQEFS
jgi:hypothetical protein